MAAPDRSGKVAAEWEGEHTQYLYAPKEDTVYQLVPAR
jgi:hypothetical protein